MVIVSLFYRQLLNDRTFTYVFLFLVNSLFREKKDKVWRRAFQTMPMWLA